MKYFIQSKRIKILLTLLFSFTASQLFAFADYTATKTNDTSDNGIVGTEFNWLVKLDNISGDSGTWSDGTPIFADSLPSSNMSLGSPSVSSSSGVSNSNRISCSYSSGSRLVCRVVGGNVVFSSGGFVVIKIPVTPLVAGVFVNPTAGNCEVNPTQDVAENNYNNNNCSDSVTVTTGVTGPDLTIAKSNNKGGLTTSSWTWAIQMSNGGTTSSVFNNGETLLIDNLPNSGVSYGAPVINSQSGITGVISCSIESSNLSCVASNGNVSISSGGFFVVNVLTTPSSSGVFNNPRTSGLCMADPDDNITEGNEVNNVCLDSITVSPNADYTATKTNDTAGFGTVGTAFNWSIKLTNISSDSGTWINDTVLFVDSFPNTNMTLGSPSVTLSTGVTGSNNISCGFVSGNRLICRVLGGNLVFSGGGSVTVIVTVTPTANGVFTNPTSGNCEVNPQEDVVELNINNNACSDSVTVSTESELSLSIIDSIDPVYIGDEYFYTVTVTNNGPSNATNINVVNTLGQGVEYIDFSGNGWNCIESPVGVVGCSRPNLAAVSAPEIVLNVTAPLSTGVVSSMATVTASENDPIANNTDSETTTITDNNSDLRISMTSVNENALLKPGDSMSYTILINNDGPDNVVSAVVNDEFPIGLNNCSWQCMVLNEGQCSLVVLNGDIFDSFDLPVGNTIQYTANCTVIQTPPNDNIENTVIVAEPLGSKDNDLTNNQSSVIVISPLFFNGFE